MLTPQIIFGYHGCDLSVARMVLKGGKLKPSINAYDWLGSGIYFWERSPARALRWAEEMARLPHSSVRKPRLSERSLTWAIASTWPILKAPPR